MRKISLAAGLLLMAASATAQTADEQPIITFKTNIYETYGGANAFHLVLGTTEETYIDVDCGFGRDEYLVGPATFDSETQGMTGTIVTCNVNSDGIVKIYGDASLLDYFDAEGCYIETIDLGDCLNLDILDLQHNELKNLDLSRYTKLSAIYLTDNPFTPETPLVVGENHPNLTILDVDIIGYISPDFDITTYPELVSFDAYATKTLTHLDPSNCKKLRRLCVDSCPIRTLDVTGCPALQVLNVEDSGIIDLDLSQNPNLTQLYVKKDSGTLNTDRKFTTLDVSGNPALTYLTAVGNLLTEINLAANTQLDYLNLAKNRLTAIDLSANQLLTSLDISQNDMTFATLPLPDPAWYDYVYDQRPMTVAKSYPAGTKLDFADKVLRAGTSTDAVMYSWSESDNEATVLGPEYFTYENGQVTLLKAVADSVYLSFGCSAFPGVRLTTGKFSVKTAAAYGKPTAALTLTPGVNDGETIVMSVGLDGATAAAPRQFMIDFGDGRQVPFTATTSGLPATPNVTATRKGSGMVTIYVPEGETLTAFGIDNTTLYAVDLTKAPELRELSLTDAGLYDVNLGFNRCLQSLDLSGNNFSTLTLEGVNAVYAKNVLGDINLSHNRLTSVTLNDPRAIDRLDLSFNGLDRFDYKEFEFISSFNISHNNLTDINITYMAQAELVDVSHNRLASIQLPDNQQIGTIRIDNNLFTLATLPEVTNPATTYVYAPQAPMVLPTKAPSINLSSQYRDIAGQTTVYTWRYDDGRALVEGTDIRGTNGRFAFLAPALGKTVFCEMTHPAFPDFTGADMFHTTQVQAAEMPDNLIASFTTPVGNEAVSLSLAAVSAGTALYIDWSGEGNAVEQYVLGDTYTLFDASTIAGADVKVYTYSPEDKITVFSISGASMSRFDASSLTDAVCIGVLGAGLTDGSLTLPKNGVLRELSLDKNAFTEFDHSEYPSLMTFSISDNCLTTLDLSHSPGLQIAAASHNALENVVLGGNDMLWQLSVPRNNIAAIDLAGAPNLEQLALGQNQLAGIDVSSLSKLIALDLSGNRFTFATLPPVLPRYMIYHFVNQQPMDVPCVDGRVDLSDQAEVNGTATEYRWFIGVPEFDENGELVGENLYVDDEYMLDNGVTTFIKPFDDVMCVMTNAEFPDLYLYTVPMSVSAGLEGVTADGEDAAPVYYNLQGVRVATPSQGIYIVVRGSQVTKEYVR